MTSVTAAIALLRSLLFLIRSRAEIVTKPTYGKVFFQWRQNCYEGERKCLQKCVPRDGKYVYFQIKQSSGDAHFIFLSLYIKHVRQK